MAYRGDAGGRYLMQQRGAWWAALAGAVIGAIIAIALAPLGLANIPALLNGVYFALTAILGAAAFGWSASRGK